MSQPKREARRVALAPLLIRCLVGGILMGLANLVPGISGGTMLLAVGVYPHFVGGVAEVTTFQFKPRTLLILGVIAGSAALAIVLLAGVVRGLVIDHRWVMYSLFIGLTLGGVPVVWKLLRRMTVSAAVGCAAGLAIMALMAVLQPGSAGGAAAERVYGMLFVAGLAGASAMILPGISGGYLLLILGQYIPILGAIDSVKSGLELRDWSRVIEAMHVVVPVGIGVLIGVVTNTSAPSKTHAGRPAGLAARGRAWTLAVPATSGAGARQRSQGAGDDTGIDRGIVRGGLSPPPLRSDWRADVGFGGTRSGRSAADLRNLADWRPRGRDRKVDGKHTGIGTRPARSGDPQPRNGTGARTFLCPPPLGAARPSDCRDPVRAGAVRRLAGG